MGSGLYLNFACFECTMYVPTNILTLMTANLAWYGLRSHVVQVRCVFPGVRPTHRTVKEGLCIKLDARCQD